MTGRSASELLEALRAITGADGVLNKPHDIVPYRGDLACTADEAALFVVRPRNTEEVAAVVRACATAGMPVIARGGGTGLAGGATPQGARLNVIVSFERMRRIRSVDSVGDVMIVEAGCTLHEVQAAAAAAGRLIGIDHGGAGSSQIGGNLSTNAGGNNVLRYGMARDQVLGLEVVLADGRVLSRLSSLRKSNAGYDLKQLFLGSEGTLGLITAAALRLHPAPIKRATVCVGVASAAAAVDFFTRARAALGESISACELMSKICVDLYLQHRQGARWPLARHTPWLLLLEADSASRYFDLDGALGALLEEAMAADIVVDGTVAASEAQRQSLWRVREGIAEAMIATPGSLKSDTAVPVAAIPAFIERAREAVVAVVPGCRPAPFGHLGDGNIHFNILPPVDMDASTFAAHWPDLVATIAEVSLALGGTVSAEHGVGLIKRAALKLMLSPVEQRLMHLLKATLDPQAVLNPKKVI